MTTHFIFWRGLVFFFLARTHNLEYRVSKCETTKSINFFHRYTYFGNKVLPLIFFFGQKTSISFTLRHKKPHHRNMNKTKIFCNVILTLSCRLRSIKSGANKAIATERQSIRFVFTNEISTACVKKLFSSNFLDQKVMKTLKCQE